MTEKRKIKRRKDEDFDFDNKKVKKPTKDEINVAKWLKKNVPTKKTKFAGHNVEYFTGSKAVDALLDSEWSRKKGDKEPFFNNRQEIVNFLNNMLRHKLFHRAKKVPVSEQELRAKMKKREKKPNEKDEKKKKEEDTTESSHAEGRDAEDKKHGTDDPSKGQGPRKKIKLEMHFDQMFVDNLDAYVWIFDPMPFYYWIIGFLVVIGAIAICLFPLWPPTVRMGVQYLSMAAAGLLILILALAVIRLIVFCLVWLLTCGTFHLWLLPNLTEDVGFFASFWPLYEYKYGKQIDQAKNKKGKKKKAKESDGEETENEKESKPAPGKDRDEQQSPDNDSENGAHSEPENHEYQENKEGENREDEETDEENGRDSQEDEEESEESEDSADYRRENGSPTDSPDAMKSKGKETRGEKDKKSTKRMARNDSEETDTESSSQHSLTGKDFEIIDKDDSDVKS